MAKITVKELEALNDEDSGRTIRDDGGLVGKVKASKNNISVAFYYRFRWENKSRDYSCGSWPKHSLSEIRKTRDEARLLLTNNINPVDHKKATQIEQQQEIERKILEAKLRETENLTVEALFTQWLHDGVSRKDKNAELKRSFHKDVIPIIGSTPLREFSEDQLRSLLRKVKSRGVNRYVIRLHKDITQMLSWAEERKPWRPLLVDGNPAKLVDPKKIIDSEYVDQRDRVLSKDELKELASIFKKLEVNYELSKTGKTLMASRPIEKKTQLALWICLSTMCRIGELLKAKWEDVDLENRTWKIPHTNSKNKVEHYIFLSDFAFDKFQELHNITGGTHFLFPLDCKQAHKTL